MIVDDRAVTPVVSTLLLVAVTVVLAATVATFALGFGAETTETAPVVSESSGTFTAFQDDSDEQIVRISHVAGDTVPTAEMEVVVDASDACGKSGRIVGLPLGDGNDDNTINAENFEGDDVFDNSNGAVEHGALNRDSYLAGETLRFRLAKGDCEVTQDDMLVVRVVHTPTNTAVIKETLRAR